MSLSPSDAHGAPLGEDRRQLMLDLLDGRPVDRVPVGFWWHYYSVPAAIRLVQNRIKGPSRVPPEVIWRVMPNNPFRAYLNDGLLKDSLAGHRRDYLALRPDFVKIMSDGFFSHPSILENRVSTAAGMRLVTPIGPDHPWIRRQVQSVKELVDFYDGEVMVFYSVFAPIQQFRLFAEYVIRDVEGFQDMLLEGREDVARAAEVVADDTILLLDALRAETGIDGVFYSVQSAQRPECDREHHDQYIKPTDLRVLDRINQLWEHNILHICGYEHYRNDLGYYAQYPASVYNWAVHTEGVSMAQGKELFDGVVLGGFDNNAGSLIDVGTPAEVVDFTRQLVEEAGIDRLILGADCTIPPDADLDRLALIRYAAAEASRHPGS
ncbi:MAG: hypothetical protein M9938_06480 [Solirubrobacterales bacterium]|nr:hypothetical protein [Solirubrobacterales bacterium]